MPRRIRGGRLGQAIYDYIVIERNSEIPGGGAPLRTSQFRDSGYENGGWGSGSGGWDPYLSRWGSIPVAYAAVNLLATSLARLPMEVGRVNEDGLFEKLPNDRLNILLKNPNPAFDGWQFWEATLRCYIAGGNSYSYIARDSRGLPVRLVPAVVSNAKRKQDGTVRRDVKEYVDVPEATQHRDVHGDDLVSLHGPDFDGESASSPIAAAAFNALSLLQLAGTHQRNTLERGFHAKGVMETDETLAGSPVDDTQTREEWVAEFSGVVNSGKTPFLPPGMKWKDIGGFSSVDLQLLELMKFTVEDIARIFNVPPRLLQHFHEGARVSQVFESQSEDFVRYSIQPHAEKIQTQLTKKLMTVEETNDGKEIRMNTDMLRAGTFTERAMSADLLAAKAGVVTINEARRLLGYPPHPDGDKLLEPKGAPPQNDDGEKGKSGGEGNNKEG